MPTEVRSSLVVTAEAKGLDKVLRQTLGLSQSAAEGMRQQAAEYKKAQAEIKGLEDELKVLVKQQAELGRAMAESTDKGSKGYQQMEADLRKTRERTKELSEAINMQERAYASEARSAKQLQRALEQLNKEQEKGRGGFLQGIAQGLGVGEYLQRGPGLGRQVAGRILGGGVRAMGGMAFGGIGGMAQALQALPGGGLLAGGLQTAAGYAGQALQFQRQRLEMAPMFAPDARQMAIARGARQQAQMMQQQLAIQPWERRRTEAFQQAGYQQVLQQVGAEQGISQTNLANIAPILETQMLGPGLSRTQMTGLRGEERLFPAERERLMAGVRARMQEIGAGAGPAREQFETAGLEGLRAVRSVSDQKQREIQEAQKQALQRERQATDAAMGGPAAIGRRLRGLGPQEALQEAGQIMQVAGGRMGDPGTSRFMEAAMAARTVYGVGPQEAGAFQMGARRGGLVGARGQGGEALRQALQDAVQLGLNGAEITNYIQTMSQGIMQFQQTGIPLNPRSLKDMSRALSGRGLAPTRAATVARTMQQAVQGVSRRGPRGGFDLMLMEEFGGFTGEGGAAELEQTYIQMEQMRERLKTGGTRAVATDEKMMNVIRRLIEMRGGGAGGRMFARDILREQAGMEFGALEMSAFGKLAMGTPRAELTRQERRAISRPGERRAELPGTMEQFTAKAAKYVEDFGPNLKQQADVAAKQLEVGGKLADAVMKMEGAAAANANAFSNLLAPAVTGVAKRMKDFAGFLENLTKEEGSLSKFSTLIAGMVD